MFLLFNFRTPILFGENIFLDLCCVVENIFLDLCGVVENIFLDLSGAVENIFLDLCGAVENIHVPDRRLQRQCRGKRSKLRGTKNRVGLLFLFLEPSVPRERALLSLVCRLSSKATLLLVASNFVKTSFFFSIPLNNELRRC